MAPFISPFILGPLFLLAATIPLIAAAWRLAGRYASTLVARCALSAFLLIAETTLILQLLGALGLWNSGALLISAWLATIITWLIAGKLSPPVHGADTAPERARLDTKWPLWVRFLVIGLPIALGLGSILAALAQPDTGADAILYHRQMVAQWMKLGTFWRIPVLENAYAYEGGYWSNGQLSTLWATIPYGRDWLTQFFPTFWFGAAWAVFICLARTLGARRETSFFIATSMSVTMAVLNMQLSHLHPDLYAVATTAVMAWTSIRWLRSDDKRIGWLIFAGVAAGLAVAAKQSLLPFCAIWCAMLVLFLIRRRLWMGVLTFIAAILAPSVLWPIRAWVWAGQPLWPNGFGPWKAPRPASTIVAGDQTVIDLARLDGVAKVTMIVAAAFLFGSALWCVWWLVRSRVLWRWARARRIAAYAVVAPICGVLGWIVTPMSGLGPGQVIIGQRWMGAFLAVTFVFLGVALLEPESPRQSPGSSRSYLLDRRVLCASLVMNAAGAIAINSMAMHGWPWWVWIVAALAGTAGGLHYATDRPLRLSMRNLAAGTGVAVVAVVIVAGPLKAGNWYPYHSEATLRKLWVVNDWMRETQPHNTRIAYAGLHSTVLMGEDLSNLAFWVGKPTANHGMAVWGETQQASWEAALLAACVDYLVVADVNAMWSRTVVEFKWAARSKIMHEVAREDFAGGQGVAVYEIDAGSTRSDCVTPGDSPSVGA